MPDEGMVKMETGNSRDLTFWDKVHKELMNGWTAFVNDSQSLVIPISLALAIFLCNEMEISSRGPQNISISCDTQCN